MIHLQIVLNRCKIESRIRLSIDRGLSAYTVLIIIKYNKEVWMCREDAFRARATIQPKTLVQDQWKIYHSEKRWDMIPAQIWLLETIIFDVWLIFPAVWIRRKNKICIRKEGLWYSEHVHVLWKFLIYLCRLRSSSSQFH